MIGPYNSEGASWLLLKLYQVAQMSVLTTNILPAPAGKYTVFGQVIDGMDVLDKMEKIKVGKPAILVSGCLRHMVIVS